MEVARFLRFQFLLKNGVTSDLKNQIKVDGKTGSYDVSYAAAAATASALAAALNGTAKVNIVVEAKAK